MSQSRTMRQRLVFADTDEVTDDPAPPVRHRVGLTRENYMGESAARPPTPVAATGLRHRRIASLGGTIGT